MEGEGTVGTLEGETSVFTWRQSKMGSEKVTLELELGREGHAERQPSREAVATLHSQ